MKFGVFSGLVESLELTSKPLTAEIAETDREERRVNHVLTDVPREYVNS